VPTALFVPETALLVPGVAGRAEELRTVREASIGAAQRLVAGAPARVVVVGPAPRPRTADAASLCASLAPLGVAERHLGWPAPCTLAGCPEHLGAPPDVDAVAAPATAVGLRLLAAAGWTGPTTVVEVAPFPVTDDAVDLAGADLLVLGSLSARREDASPRAADPRAIPTDTALAADLAAPAPAALARLGDLDTALADELDITGAGPWRLVASWLAGRTVAGDVVGGDEGAQPALGMDYRVWSWRWSA